MSFESGIAPYLPPVEAPTPERPGFWKRALTVGTAAVALAVSLVSGPEFPTPHEAAQDRSVSAAPDPLGPAEISLPLEHRYTFEDPAHTFINSVKISNDIDRAVKSGDLPAYKVPGIVAADGTKGLPADLAEGDYSTLYTFTYKDGQIYYTDKSHGIVSESDERKILGSVAANPLIAATMQAGELNNVYVDLYAPTDPNDEFPPQMNGAFIPEDTTGGKTENNIHLMLQSNMNLDQESLTTLLSHESIHAALQQGLESGQLSPEDHAVIAKACSVLRRDASDKLKHYSRNITDQLRYLRQHTGRQYAPAYTKVMEAIQQGTFDRLPVYEEASEVPECIIQAPMAAVFNVAISMGILPVALEHQLKTGKFNNQLDVLHDGWASLVSYNTVINLIREETYLPKHEYNVGVGHPSNNSDETVVSVLDVIMQYPEQAAAMMSSMTKSEKEAVLAIANTTVNNIVEKYPDEIPLKFRLYTSMHVFERALAADSKTGNQPPELPVMSVPDTRFQQIITPSQTVSTSQYVGRHRREFATLS